MVQCQGENGDSTFIISHQSLRRKIRKKYGKAHD